MLDKLEKKDHLIIFVLCLIVISLGILIVSKNFKNIGNEKVSVDKNINLDINNNVNVDKNLNINLNKNINQNININTNQNPKDKYKGELTEEADGWKKYRNEYWGVEFRFKDIEDRIKVTEWSVGVIVVDSKTGNPYVNIYMDGLDYSGKKYNNLKKYLEAGSWINIDAVADLISLKEITNNNELEFIEVIFKYKSIGQASRLLTSNESKIYYIEYDNKIVNKDEESTRLLRNTQDYISIRKISSGDDFQQQIVDTFKFID